MNENAEREIEYKNGIEGLTPDQIYKIESIIKDDTLDSSLEEVMYRDTKKGIIYTSISSFFVVMAGLSPVMAVSGMLFLCYQAINAYERSKSAKVNFFKKYNQRIVEVAIGMIIGVLLYYFGYSAIWLFLSFVWSVIRMTGGFFGLLMDQSKRVYSLKEKLLNVFGKKSKSKVDVETVPMTSEEINEVVGKVEVETKNRYNT